MIKNYLIIQKKIDQRLEVFFNKKIVKVKEISPVLDLIIKEKRNFTMQGGKRIRPVFLYYGYLAAGGSNKKAILDVSIFIELIHSYLLIHDDIIDQDRLRRGKPTLHYRYEALYKKDPKKAHVGVSLGIVAGDMLCAYGYEILSASDFPDRNKIKALGKLNAVLSDVIAGQELDILYSAKPNITLEDILKVSEYKTARYTIEGPLHIGAILAGAGVKTISTLSKYAIPLGIAFQIQDDILGIFGDEKQTGKSSGSDFKQNKQNILIFWAQKHANYKQKKIISRALGNEHITKSQLEEMRKIIKETKSLEYANTLAQTLVGQAKAAIEKSDLVQPAKSFLNDIANYIVSRNN